jgi:hypothetical protein
MRKSINHKPTERERKAVAQELMEQSRRLVFGGSPAEEISVNPLHHHPRIVYR